MHDPVSAFELGLLYSTEPGHEHDAAKAVGPLRQSVDAGYVPAMHSLAVLELHHPELARESGEAEQLLRRGEEAGDWKSSMVLGVLARAGKGAGTDCSQAYLHFRIAALQGGAEVEELVSGDVERLRGVLTAAATEQLDVEAASWVEKHPRQPDVLRRNDYEVLLLKVPGAEQGATSAR